VSVGGLADHLRKRFGPVGEPLQKALPRGFALPRRLRVQAAEQAADESVAATSCDSSAK
jgi:hypothetical protein